MLLLAPVTLVVVRGHRLGVVVDHDRLVTAPGPCIMIVISSSSQPWLDVPNLAQRARAAHGAPVELARAADAVRAAAQHLSAPWRVGGWLAGADAFPYHGAMIIEGDVVLGARVSHVEIVCVRRILGGHSVNLQHTYTRARAVRTSRERRGSATWRACLTNGTTPMLLRYERTDSAVWPVHRAICKSEKPALCAHAPPPQLPAGRGGGEPDRLHWSTAVRGSEVSERFCASLVLRPLLLARSRGARPPCR
jgi:hypothetical protein